MSTTDFRMRLAASTMLTRERMLGCVIGPSRLIQEEHPVLALTFGDSDEPATWPSTRRKTS